MAEKMSLCSRRELTAVVRDKYPQLSWNKKRKILDGFIAATGYERKYAISLLTKNKKQSPENVKKLTKKTSKYKPCSKMKCNPLEYLLNQIQDGVADEEIPPIIL